MCLAIREMHRCNRSSEATDWEGRPGGCHGGGPAGLGPMRPAFGGNTETVGCHFVRTAGFHSRFVRCTISFLVFVF